MASLPGKFAVCDILCIIKNLSMELIRSYPKFYLGVCHQMGVSVVTEINSHICEETDELIPVQLGGWLDLAKI